MKLIIKILYHVAFFFLFPLLLQYFTEPTTHIIGAPDMYIESGSTINLTCIIENSPEPPAYIFWNHNNAVSNFKRENQDEGWAHS